MYDVIVVGGGHAGIEASHISAKMGKNTLLITGNVKNIGDMPCNPSIGGTAKGIIVREVDALGGLMGRIADLSHIQIKMLNNSKGPAVRSLRAQADKVTYPKKMQEYLQNMPNLTIKEALVEDLIIENNVVKGIITENNERIESKTVILTTGTYLFRNIVDVNGNLKIGKKYPYEISVKNSGEIDTYVRVILTKSMYNKDGEKATNLSLDVLDLHLLNSDDWIVDETATTEYRTVMYYKKILLAGETTTSLTDYIRIDDSILWKAEEKNITEKNGCATIMMD